VNINEDKRAFIASVDAIFYFNGKFTGEFWSQATTIPEPNLSFIVYLYINEKETFTLINVEPTFIRSERFDTPFSGVAFFNLYSLSATFTKENSSMDIKKGDEFIFRIKDGTYNNYMTNRQDEKSSLLSLIPETKEVLFDSAFPIIPNLPDITALDFVKNFMLLFGLFAYYDTIGNTDAVRFFSVNEIYDKIPDAKNWTDKLINENWIDSIVFTFQDYAQKNWIHYLKDETVTTNADGSIDIDSKTVEKEKNIAELKFAPSDEYDELIEIPLYKKEGDGEAQKSVYEKSSNRIALMEIGTDSSEARFNEYMYFRGTNGRINRFYQKYKEILSHPKVIEATFRLNELDLHNIDLLTPVYLEQTGQYYAIIDINANEDKAKCKLLQM
jgi:hypothetical protein